MLIAVAVRMSLAVNICLFLAVSLAHTNLHALACNARTHTHMDLRLAVKPSHTCGAKRGCTHKQPHASVACRVALSVSDHGGGACDLLSVDVPSSLGILRRCRKPWRRRRAAPAPSLPRCWTRSWISCRRSAHMPWRAHTHRLSLSHHNQGLRIYILRLSLTYLHTHTQTLTHMKDVRFSCCVAAVNRLAYSAALHIVVVVEEEEVVVEVVVVVVEEEEEVGGSSRLHAGRQATD